MHATVDKCKLKIKSSSMTNTSLPSEENCCGCKSKHFGSFGGDDDSIATERKYSSSCTQVNLLNIRTHPAEQGRMYKSPLLHFLHSSERTVISISGQIPLTSSTRTEAQFLYESCIGEGKTCN